MPRVFKKLDRTIIKYIKFLRIQSGGRVETSTTAFNFKGWNFTATFNNNRGIQPFFTILMQPTPNIPSGAIPVPNRIELRWYGGTRVGVHGERSIGFQYMDAPPELKVFWQSKYEVEINQLPWFFRTLRKYTGFSLNDFDLFTSKFTELMVKMI